MKLPCPEGECGLYRCPLENLSSNERTVAIALAKTAFEAFGPGEQIDMTREQRESLLTLAERSKDKQVPMPPEDERLTSPQVYALIATAMHRQATGTCKPTT